MAVLDLVLGPTVIGVLFNVFLYGTMCVQCYHYFITFKEDSKRVWFLLFADSANTILECVVLYEYTITDFGDFSAVTRGNWRAGTGPILTGLISAAVQGYFAWRVYRLTRMLWLCVPIYAAIIVQFIAASGVGIGGSIITPFAEWDKWQIKVPIVTWLVLAAVVDCAITGILIGYLSRSRTGFPSTDHLITRLIRPTDGNGTPVTVETGMITAVWAVLDLILYLSNTHPVHLIFNLALPKLYSNSLLSTLNSRLRSGGHSSHSGPITDLTWKVVDVPKGHAPTNSGVHVSTTSQVHRDEFELGEISKEDLVTSVGKDDCPVDKKGGDSHLDLEANRQAHPYALKWAEATGT